MKLIQDFSNSATTVATYSGIPESVVADYPLKQCKMKDRQLPPLVVLFAMSEAGPVHPQY